MYIYINNEGGGYNRRQGVIYKQKYIRTYMENKICTDKRLFVSCFHKTIYNRVKKTYLREFHD